MIKCRVVFFKRIIFILIIVLFPHKVTCYCPCCSPVPCLVVPSVAEHTPSCGWSLFLFPSKIKLPLGWAEWPALVNFPNKTEYRVHGCGSSNVLMVVVQMLLFFFFFGSLKMLFVIIKKMFWAILGLQNSERKVQRVLINPHPVLPPNSQLPLWMTSVVHLLQLMNR